MMAEEQRKVRLRSGEGPQVTVPDFMLEDVVDPELWVTWFLEQTHEAQVSIAEYHLWTERTLAGIEVVLQEAAEEAYARKQQRSGAEASP